MDQGAQDWAKYHSGEGDKPVGYHGESNPNPGNGFGGIGDPVAMAQKIQQFNVQSNQPAINTLQQQYNPATGSGALVDRYSKLLDSIKGVGSVSVNQQTLATNNEMGARGILPSSGLFQQQLANSLQPVTAGIENQLSTTGLGEQQDLGNISAQIASLQTGNPESAMTGASNILGIQQQAQNVQSQLQTSLALQKLQQQAYAPINYGQQLFQPSSGNFSNTSGGVNMGNIRMVNGVPMINIPG